ncbi:uncharacterized protein J7T54_005148 [Emericellopsis cladophorae]|uniref:Chitin-binding type-2 domain-containing protein n=1 Tax=Emericellopsis cladophorae TaxID=2686198 RepID=A0A9P9Y2H0_9HYPO|nr:uncharacterized protein J7T54_005148 [Emericellopsis cladophorae]KAI6781938.1 hypothetical protein J7T54_005148 [Emericellopsis cladophorae]
MKPSLFLAPALSLVAAIVPDCPSCSKNMLGESASSARLDGYREFMNLKGRSYPPGWPPGYEENKEAYDSNYKATHKPEGEKQEPQPPPEEKPRPPTEYETMPPPTPHESEPEYDDDPEYDYEPEPEHHLEPAPPHHEEPEPYPYQHLPKPIKPQPPSPPVGSACHPGTYTCDDSTGWQVCDVGGYFVHAGVCPPDTVCKFYEASKSPYCVPPDFVIS